MKRMIIPAALVLSVALAGCGARENGALEIKTGSDVTVQKREQSL